MRDTIKILRNGKPIHTSALLGKPAVPRSRAAEEEAKAKFWAEIKARKEEEERGAKGEGRGARGEEGEERRDE